jgi:hypothetical protein
MELIRDICVLYENYGFDTEVLAASIRTPDHVKEAASGARTARPSRRRYSPSSSSTR